MAGSCCAVTTLSMTPSSTPLDKQSHYARRERCRSVTALTMRDPTNRTSIRQRHAMTDAPRVPALEYERKNERSS